MTRVKVTEIKGAYAFEGVSYGPFQASKDKPFTEVPESLASALSLPLHEDEVKAREAARPEPEADGEGVDVQVILKANQDLKADLDAITQERDRLKAELNTARARIAELKAAPQSPEKSDHATPLVDGLPLTDLLTGNNITTMEALEAGLKVPEGADQSPVEAISGIGKKTVEAYTKAVADWRKGQAN